MKRFLILCILAVLTGCELLDSKDFIVVEPSTELSFESNAAITVTQYGAIESDYVDLGLEEPGTTMTTETAERLQSRTQTPHHLLREMGLQWF